MFIKFLDHDLRYGIGRAKKRLTLHLLCFSPFDLTFSGRAHFRAHRSAISGISCYNGRLFLGIDWRLR